MTDSSEARRVSRRRFLLGFGALGGAGVAGSLFWRSGQDGPPGPAGFRTAERTGFALGADVSIVALHEDRAAAVQAIEAAFAELETVESVMSLNRPQSELCRLNREGVLAGPHPYLVRVLQKARAVSAASRGDFDITVQPLWTLYVNTVKDGQLPSEKDIDRTRRQVDWRRVAVRPDRIDLKGDGTAVTLNGIAQGFAADRALAALTAGGVRHALVNTGEIGAMGRRRDGAPWTIGIQHPRDKDAFVSRAHLDSRCVATSGDYGTRFSADREHNHIFDPRTGRSPQAFQSVTVLAKTGLEADALSTAIFVTGLQRGMKLVESTPGADALFVLKDGKTRATSGFPEVERHS